MSLHAQSVASYRTDQRYLGLALTGVALVISLALAGFVLINPASVWLVVALAVAALVLWQPRYGLFLIVGLALLIDPQPADPVVAPGRFLYQAFDTFTPLRGAVFTPLELLIAWTVLAALLRREGRVVFGDLFLPLMGLAGALLLGLYRGMTSGGDMTVALWEVRALLSLVPIYLLVTNLVREKRHVFQLVAVLLIAIALMSAESIWRYFTYVREYRLNAPYDLAFGHVNGPLAATMVVLALSQALWAGRGWRRWAYLLPMALGGVAVLVLRRRAGIVALETGVLLVALALVLENRRLFFILIPVGVLASIVYLNVFWANTGSLGQPARVFRTVTGAGLLSSRDLASDDYRTAEAENIRLNISWQPVQGLGFGNQYVFAVRMPDLSWWPFWHYIPHNTIFWFWLKAGVVGFVMLLTLLGAALVRGAQLVRETADRTLKPIAITSLAYVVMLIMFSYVDLGLVDVRATILLGVALGLIGSLGKVQERDGGIKQAG